MVLLPSRGLQSNWSFRTRDLSPLKPLEGRVRACQPGVVIWRSAKRARDRCFLRGPHRKILTSRVPGRVGSTCSHRRAWCRWWDLGVGRRKMSMELQGEVEESAREMENGLREYQRWSSPLRLPQACPCCPKHPSLEETGTVFRPPQPVPAPAPPPPPTARSVCLFCQSPFLPPFPCLLSVSPSPTCGGSKADDLFPISWSHTSLL